MGFIASQTLERIDEAIKSARPASAGRAHLGASIIGRECEAELFWSFRWADSADHPARVLRLFARGEREEHVFNDLLRKADVTVWDVDPDTNQQWAVEAVGGHFGGHLDGVLKGLAEVVEALVSEQKTHNDRSFKDVRAKGVENSKPEHYAQMQVYMHLMSLSFALYQAVNKNDDDLYFEIVEYDAAFAERLLAKAEKIITSDFPLTRISDDPTFYKCKFCDQADVCHTRRAPQVNCRTCRWATPELDGNARWSCGKHNRDLSVEDQRVGCDSHNYLPTLLQSWADVIDFEDDWVTYRSRLNNQEFSNGHFGYSSNEIRAAHDLRAIGNKNIDEIREAFEGEITW